MTKEELCHNATKQGYDLLTTKEKIDCLPHTGQDLTSIVVFSVLFLLVGIAFFVSLWFTRRSGD
jgi:LPXTG-motif cell wall-anchored protein